MCRCGLRHRCVDLHLILIGKAQNDHAESIASNAIICGLYISIAISAILIVFVGQIVILLGAEGVSEQAKQYLLPMSITASAMICYVIMTNLLKAEGAAKKVSVSVLLNVAINMVLDPILIFGAGLGVAGAAWATSIGNIVSVLVIYL